MHLEDEQHFLQTMKTKYNFQEISHLDLCNNIITDHTQACQIVGNDFTKNQQEEVLVPVTLPGKVNLFSNNRYFLRTPEVAVMGLCGGPVLLGDENGIIQCMGMVEALVSPPKDAKHDTPLEHIYNNTMVVPSPDIKLFLGDVEKQLEEETLVVHSARPKYSKDFLDSL